MEFLSFSQESLDATLKKWGEEAEQYDVFPGEVNRKLAWIQAALTSGAKNSSHKTIAYGVFKPGEQVAVCTCELVLSDRGQLAGKWLKLLNVTLSPEVEVLTNAEDLLAIQTVVQAYKTATLGAFEARLDHDADTLKLYGRTEEQLKFLVTLLAVLQEGKSTVLEAKKEGRWLVLRSQKGN